MYFQVDEVSCQRKPGLRVANMRLYVRRLVLILRHWLVALAIKKTDCIGISSFNACQVCSSVINTVSTQYACRWQVMRLPLRKAVFASLYKKYADVNP
jgi:DNA polymerase sigma